MNMGFDVAMSKICQENIFLIIMQKSADPLTHSEIIKRNEKKCILKHEMKQLKFHR